MNQVPLTLSLLKWPKYCFMGLIILVWRSVAHIYCKFPSYLDPKTFSRVFTIPVVDLYAFKALFNIEHDSSSSSSLLVLKKQPIAIHCDPSVMWGSPQCFSYSYDIITSWVGMELQFLLLVPRMCVSAHIHLRWLVFWFLSLRGS